MASGEAPDLTEALSLDLAGGRLPHFLYIALSYVVTYDLLPY